jgi:hypothetical protein
MVVRWIIFLLAAFIFVSAANGQRYPGYYIDSEGFKKDVIFLIDPVLFSRQPDFGSITTGIIYYENGQCKRLTPGMCQSIFFRHGEEQIEFLSLPNLMVREFYNTDSLFLRPKIIGQAALYYFYFNSHSPALNIRNDGTAFPRKPGPLSITKQGWIIAKDDGSVYKITRRSNRKDIAVCFDDYNYLAAMIRSGITKSNIKATENLVNEYNTWKTEQELLRANIKK